MMVAAKEAANIYSVPDTIHFVYINCLNPYNHLMRQVLLQSSLPDTETSREINNLSIPGHVASKRRSHKLEIPPHL